MKQTLSISRSLTKKREKLVLPLKADRRNRNVWFLARFHLCSFSFQTFQTLDSSASDSSRSVVLSRFVCWSTCSIFTLSLERDFASFHVSLSPFDQDSRFFFTWIALLVSLVDSFSLGIPFSFRLISLHSLLCSTHFLTPTYSSCLWHLLSNCESSFILFLMETESQELSLQPFLLWHPWNGYTSPTIN